MLVGADGQTDHMLMRSPSCPRSSSEVRPRIVDGRERLDGYLDVDCDLDGNTARGRIDFTGCQ